MDRRSETKMKYKDAFLPSAILVLVTAIVFAGFYLIKSVNNKLICQIADVAGEETNPSAGRLIVCLLFFALSVSLVIMAEKRWKTYPEKLLLTFAFAVMGGTLLWTSIGECSWHFLETGMDIYA